MFVTPGGVSSECDNGDFNMFISEYFGCSNTIHNRHGNIH
ncbi:Uncharacterised protein [Vibrio cholerae]|nr:Uncharacterised protein [Vibrio cholerae]